MQENHSEQVVCCKQSGTEREHVLIGEVIKRSGFTREAILYFVEFGLIHRFKRKNSPYWHYPAENLEVLKLISRLKPTRIKIKHIPEFQQATPQRQIQLLQDQRKQLLQEIEERHQAVQATDDLIQDIKHKRCP